MSASSVPKSGGRKRGIFEASVPNMAEMAKLGLLWDRIGILSYGSHVLISRHCALGKTVSVNARRRLRQSQQPSGETADLPAQSCQPIRFRQGRGFAIHQVWP